MKIRFDLCRNLSHFLTVVLGLSSSAALASERSDSYNRMLPPAWQTTNGDESPQRTQREPSANRRVGRPWYKPRAAAGIGLNFPEIMPLEGYLFFGRYFALRGFYTPPIPFDIRIEMPADILKTTKAGLGVANPDYTIKLKAVYGPFYGAEALIFPFAGSFYITAGASYRRMKLDGHARSAVLVCSLIEVAKDPPCGNPDASIRTRTELDLKASVTTTALLMRGGLGWFWHVGSAAYFNFNAGMTKPTSIKRSIHVNAALDTPGDDSDELTGALAEVKKEQESDLEKKALKEMRPVEEKLLPIIGISAGIRF